MNKLYIIHIKNKEVTSIRTVMAKDQNEAKEKGMRDYQGQVVEKVEKAIGFSGWI